MICAKSTERRKIECLVTALVGAASFAVLGTLFLGITLREIRAEVYWSRANVTTLETATATRPCFGRATRDFEAAVTCYELTAVLQIVPPLLNVTKQARCRHNDCYAEFFDSFPPIGETAVGVFNPENSSQFILAPVVDWRILGAIFALSVILVACLLFACLRGCWCKKAVYPEADA